MSSNGRHGMQIGAAEGPNRAALGDGEGMGGTMRQLGQLVVVGRRKPNKPVQPAREKTARG
jgi:hypothetical protein